MHIFHLFFILLLHPAADFKKDAVPAHIYVKQAVKSPIPASIGTEKIKQLFTECNLLGLLPFEAFCKCMEGYDLYKPVKHIVAICDFSKTSDQKRFVVVDLDQKKVLSHTYVAHGKNSGELKAVSFSNEKESHKSSLGFFRVGEVIQTALHGPSLLLDGLEKGKNDNARAREIIIHGAWYAAESFIHQYGYCGKSFGCPALPEQAMKALMPVLANGSLLYIYAK